VEDAAAVHGAALRGAVRFTGAVPSGCEEEASRIEVERSFDAAQSWAVVTQAVATTRPPVIPPTNTVEAAAAITAVAFIVAAQRIEVEPRIEAARLPEAEALVLLTTAAVEAADVVADSLLGRCAPFLYCS
jgi:hypothetical protein